MVDIARDIQHIININLPGRKLLFMKPLKGGLQNNTLLLCLDDQTKYVLRIMQRTNYMKYIRNDSFSSYQVAADECLQNKVLAPKVLTVDTSRSVIDTTYMLMEFIDGQPINSYALIEEDRINCYFQAGQAMNVMHHIKGDQFGRPFQVKRHNGFTTWSEALLFEVRDLLDYAETTKLYTSINRNEIESVFQANRRLLDEITQPFLVHGDLWSGNILVNRPSDAYKFCGYIDFDQSLFGDPQYDFSGGMLNSPFGDGYQVGCIVEENSILRRKLYLLIYSLDHYIIFNQLLHDEKYSMRQLVCMKQILDFFSRRATQ